MGVRIAGSLLLAGLLLASFSAQATEATAEYRLKAALLYKLTKFVTWPPRVEPFEICVYGGNPFGDAIRGLERRSVGERRVVIRYPSRVNDGLGRCSILYLTKAIKGDLRSLLLATSFSPVLTISDIPNFADIGGMIELRNLDQRIGFRINLRAAEGAKLRIASPLLELSTIVQEY